MVRWLVVKVVEVGVPVTAAFALMLNWWGVQDWVVQHFTEALRSTLPG